MMGFFFYLIGFLAIGVFFVMLWKTRSRKEAMKQEDEWMQSLPPEEWGSSDDEEEDDEEEKDN